MNTKRERVTQYEIRAIDPNGDVIDAEHVFDGRGSKRRAVSTFADEAKQIANREDVAALILERVEMVGSDAEGVEDMDYVVMDVAGDAEALERGGWTIGGKS
jgi:hypothetical protein